MLPLVWRRGVGLLDIDSACSRFGFILMWRSVRFIITISMESDPYTSGKHQNNHGDLTDPGATVEKSYLKGGAYSAPSLNFSISNIARYNISQATCW